MKLYRRKLFPLRPEVPQVVAWGEEMLSRGSGYLLRTQRRRPLQLRLLAQERTFPTLDALRSVSVRLTLRAELNRPLPGV